MLQKNLPSHYPTVFHQTYQVSLSNFCSDLLHTFCRAFYYSDIADFKAPQQQWSQKVVLESQQAKLAAVPSQTSSRANTQSIYIREYVEKSINFMKRRKSWRETTSFNKIHTSIHKCFSLMMSTPMAPQLGILDGRLIRSGDDCRYMA